MLVEMHLLALLRDSQGFGETMQIDARHCQVDLPATGVRTHNLYRGATENGPRHWTEIFFDIL